MAIIKGCRREDQPTLRSGLPEDFKPGDYWRACVQNEVGNGTHWEWWICAPNGLVGRIPLHHVIEHKDKTITVMPNQPVDGHMNSILIEGAGGKSWHGWIKKGMWSESWEELEKEVK